LRLKVGDYEIPERCLRYVVLYRAAPVSFGGVLVGKEGSQVKEKLRRLTQMKAVSFEAVDSNGVYATGVCDLRNLKFDENTTPATIFSGELVYPFEQEHWDVDEVMVRMHGL
jgi:hypothetical protein